MDMEEFLIDHPWAADLAKSELLMKIIEYLQSPRTVDEIQVSFPELTDDDIAKTLYVLKEIGVVEGDGEKVWLSQTGREFLKAYKETF